MGDISHWKTTFVEINNLIKMLFILSPTKSMNNSVDTEGYGDEPQYLNQTHKLIKQLKKLSKDEVNTLMKMSDKLLESTILGYKDFKMKSNADLSGSAVLTYAGEAYNSMQPGSWTKTDRKYADKHVRLLSGLYGILKPSDLIQNYRLEMGAKSKSILGQTLYQYWSDIITADIKEDLSKHKHQILVNLASNEYSKTITKNLTYPMINVDFKEEKNGKLKVVSFNAKKARGMMINFIVENKVDSIDDLKQFNLDGYSLINSDGSNLLFTK